MFASKITVSDPRIRKMQEERKYPKGFDITLVDIFEQYEMTEEVIEEFRKLHEKSSSLLYMLRGRDTFYVKSQLDDILPKKVK